MNARTMPPGILGTVVLAVALLVPGCSGDNMHRGEMHPDEALISALESVFLTLRLSNRYWMTYMDCGSEDLECRADWYDQRICTHLRAAGDFARLAAPLVGTEPEVMSNAADSCDAYVNAVRRGDEEEMIEKERDYEAQVNRYVNGARRHAERLRVSIPRNYETRQY